jgi:hypothetical protein
MRKIVAMTFSKILFQRFLEELNKVTKISGKINCLGVKFLSQSAKYGTRLATSPLQFPVPSGVN